MKKLIAVAIAGVSTAAAANPNGAAVVSGAALLSNPSASVMQIVNTPGTIINWQGFSIGAGETTRFVQLNAASAVLNRVVGANPSDILGRLESNGRVFLVNPNGIVFGAGAVVDAAGLIASTRDISNANFTAGHYLFNGAGSGDITVRSGAQILTSSHGPGGQVWLFAKNVTTEAGSTITAPQGQVVLAAGTQLEVATSQAGQMSFTLLTDGTSTIDALGRIAADRGAVGMFADFINHRGEVNAGDRGTVAMDATRELRIQGTSRIDAPDGTIALRSGNLLEVEYDAAITADGANGSIVFESNNLLVATSGNVHATGGRVTFNQFQDSQYFSGALQQSWITPAGHTDGEAIIYRRNDGNYVLRFSRSTSSGDAVGIFEVILDSRTGAVLSGPALLSASEAAAYNAERAAVRAFGESPSMPGSIENAWRAAYDAAWAAYHGSLQPLAVTSDAAYNAYLAAQATTSADFTRAYDAWLAAIAAANAQYEIDFNQAAANAAIAAANATKDAAEQTALAGSNAALDRFNTAFAAYREGEIAASQAKQAAFNAADAARNAAEAAVRAAWNADLDVALAREGAARDAYNAALKAGVATYSTSSAARNVSSTPLPAADGGSLAWAGAASNTYEIRSGTGVVLGAPYRPDNGSVLPMTDGRHLLLVHGSYDIRARDGGVQTSGPLDSGGDFAVVPNRLGGFSVIDLGGAGARSQWTFAKVVAPYTAVNRATGGVGSASALASRPGQPTNTGVLVPPTPPPAPVVSGNPGGGASFDGVAGCNSAVCAQNVRTAISVTDAMRAASDFSGKAGSGSGPENAIRNALGSAERETVEALARSVIDMAKANPERKGVLLVEDADVNRVMRDRTLTPEQKAEQLKLLQKQALIEQQLGAAPDPAGREDGARGSLIRENVEINLLVHMSDEEIVAYSKTYVAPQLTGEDAPGR